MEIFRYTAFSSDPSGGNPAGVVLDARGLDDAAMLAVAAEVGYSETAFLLPTDSDRVMDVRYFSPLAEVSFCGHATIATAVAYAERHGVGDLTLHTKVGVVPVHTAAADDGTLTATLVSVPTKTEDLHGPLLAELLGILGWTASDLHDALPPRIAFGGAWHPILATPSRSRLAELDYDMPALRALMERQEWTTIDLIWRESPDVFQARNPFPVGGVFEDPATGAAAAAFGGYLRELQLVPVPGTVTVHQGVDMGRPSLLTLGIPVGEGGISVSGTAVALTDAS
ncbi:PhzF family phenazine biosynthesis isomerase [Catenulispora sp. NF23]|uniref:PhzF family phenazine biosynthesis isomerase n=1 Tax=Catenulispora pinistramenti TaxID=2705254 RepID=A0ABS5KYX3_9ACTN|nr:PhzF family phenazine biosynthesis isomerase [Catenulispora pinistramenti]MBS2534687.1 PhzF family phenazine biosynthesis isomerase [Catenulispora pinistramenti]MBS2551200.1 PhzF family phenazine biosynthesis isomerase [Catenulispora pinistramenti]